MNMTAKSVNNAAKSLWPSLVVILGVVGVYLTVPDSLVIGPRWLHPTLLILLLVAIIITHRREGDSWSQILGHVLAGALTLFMIGSLLLLVNSVPGNKESPLTMIRSAAALWTTNMLVFGYWYWRLDGGGPGRRCQSSDLSQRAFLFPQMTLPKSDGTPVWEPRFMDYLFVAFNTNAAFSPTDTPVLSRPAKVLTMIQAGISLTVVVVLAARAIGNV